MKLIDITRPIYTGMWNYSEPMGSLLGQFKLTNLKFEFGGEKYSIELFDGFKAQTGTYLESKLSEINFSISVFETLFIKNKIVDHYGDIEIYAVVLDRLREAELMMDEAYEAFYEEDFERAIYLMSYAEVRKNTAYNWVSLISEFKGNLYLQFDSVNLKEKSLERIEQSKTSIMYAETVVDNRILAGAKEHLESAIDAYNDGKFVFALFEASKARAESNLAMEIRSVTDETLDYKLSSLENEARVSIKKAQEKGLLPILALSYLEFGMTLKETEPVQSLIFLSYSKEMAQISEDLYEATVGKPVSSGVDIDKYYDFSSTLDAQSRLYLQLATLLTGFLCGVSVVIYAIDKKK